MQNYSRDFDHEEDFYDEDTRAYKKRRGNPYDVDPYGGTPYGGTPYDGKHYDGRGEDEDLYDEYDDETPMPPPRQKTRQMQKQYNKHKLMSSESSEYYSEDEGEQKRQNANRRGGTRNDMLQDTRYTQDTRANPQSYRHQGRP